MKHKTVLGILFLEETTESVLEKAEYAWQNHMRLRIATVNPEFLVRSERDALFKKNIQQADVKVVDGVGLWAALRLKGFQGKRLTGIHLSAALLSLAENKKRTVLVLVKKEGLSSVAQVQSALLKKYPHLLLTVAHPSDAVKGCADLTLIALGLPEQEYWAERCSKGVVMGVGGTMDFITGMQVRAPKMFQALGLEWLWRLLLQPKRFTRIWNAVIVFPLLVIFDKKKADSA